MKILKVLMILCSVFILSLSFADDDYEEHHKDKKYEKRHEYRSLEYLDLDKVQYHKIRNILLEYKKKYQKYLEVKNSKVVELQKIMQSETFDKNKYIEIQNQLKEDSIKMDADKFKRIHDVLTPKQRVRFSYFLGEWEID